jgi:hypothetical protein
VDPIRAVVKAQTLTEADLKLHLALNQARTLTDLVLNPPLALKVDHMHAVVKPQTLTDLALNLAQTLTGVALKLPLAQTLTEVDLKLPLVHNPDRTLTEVAPKPHLALNQA